MSIAFIFSKKAHKTSQEFAKKHISEDHE